MMRALLISLLLIGNVFAQDATVKVKWDPNSESDLAGYKVYYGKTSNNYSDMVDLGNATTVDIRNLERGVTYYFAATAYDNSGNESGYSKEVALAIPKAPDTQPPAPPANVRVEIVTGG